MPQANLPEIIHVIQWSYEPTNPPLSYFRTHFQPHFHSDYNELFLVETGELGLITRGKNICLKAGSVAFILRGNIHKACVLHTRVQLLRVFWNELPRLKNPHYPIHVIDSSGAVRYMLQRMLSLFPPSTALDQLELRKIFAKVLRNLASKTNLPPQGWDISQERFHQVQDYIQKNLARNIHRNDLAKIACLSPSRFDAQFKNATGLTPMRYIRQMRIEVAQTYLLTSSLTLKAVAPLVGLKDEFQLSRVFRKVTGISPRVFRQRANRVPAR